MATDRPRPRARRRHVGPRRAWAVASLIAVAAAIAGAPATPASAAAAPAARTRSDATAEPGRAGRSVGSGTAGGQRTAPGQLNVAMLIVAVGMGLAITAPIACRERIARERSILGFRGQLRNADLVSLCQPRPAAQDQTGFHDPPPPASGGR